MMRDFSDGVLVAQILKQYYPKIIQIHNYQSANSLSAKYLNWKTLNEKVLKKIGFQIHRTDIQNLIKCQQGTVQKVLYYIYQQLQHKKIVTQSNYKKVQDNHKNILLSKQLAQKQDIIRQLRDTIEILQAKMKKMEQLCKLKDAKIDSLLQKIQSGFIK